MTAPRTIAVWVCPSGRHTAWPRPGSVGQALVRSHETTRNGEIVAPLCAGRPGGHCGDCRMVMHTYVLACEAAS